MQSKFDISFKIDLSVFGNLERIEEGIQADLARVVQDTGNILVAEWTREATLALKNPGSYLQRIGDGLTYPFNSDPLHLIIVNTHPAARLLEEGYNPFDMKKILSTSSKVKIGKDGKRYIHIPFQHPEDSLRRAGLNPEEYRGLAASTKLPKARPEDPNRYRWGDRLTDMGNVGKKRKFFSGLDGPLKGKTIDYNWKASPFENIVRFQDHAGQTSSFTSFRTISEKSDPSSWIHPGQRALRIAETAVNSVRPQFEAAVSKVVKDAITSAFAG